MKILKPCHKIYQILIHKAIIKYWCRRWRLICQMSPLRDLICSFCNLLPRKVKMSRFLICWYCRNNQIWCMLCLWQYFEKVPISNHLNFAVCQCQHCCCAKTTYGSKHSEWVDRRVIDDECSAACLQWWCPLFSCGQIFVDISRNICTQLAMPKTDTGTFH